MLGRSASQLSENSIKILCLLLMISYRHNEACIVIVEVKLNANIIIITVCMFVCMLLCSSTALRWKCGSK